MNFNRVILLGRLTRDPELRTTPNGQTVCSFGIATNRVFTDSQGQKQERVEYHNIVAWARLGEICGKYLTRGQLILIEGRMETRSWNTPEGDKKQKTEIIAENMQMGPRAGQGASAAGTESKYTADSSNQSEKKQNDTGEINVEEIPF